MEFWHSILSSLNLVIFVVPQLYQPHVAIAVKPFPDMRTAKKNQFNNLNY